MIGLVSALPDEAARIADRLGRFGDGDGVVLGDVPLAELSTDSIRRRIVVSEADPVLFSGQLRRELDPWGRVDGDDEEIHSAIAVANAEDVVEALPEGLDDDVDERGRSFSGGQRQRLVLARALLSEAEMLVLVEPTSAVDAHTEARIARRLREAREGKTTVIITASPLVLDQADRVVLRRGRARRRRGHAPRAAEDEPRLPLDRHARVRTCERAAPDRVDGPELREQARRLGRRHRRALLGMVVLHAAAAAAGLAGPAAARRARPVGPGRHDDRARRQARRLCSRVVPRRRRRS